MMRTSRPSLFLRILIVLLVLASQVWLVSAAAPQAATSADLHAAFLRPAAATDVTIGYKVTLDAKGTTPKGKPTKPAATAATGILGPLCGGTKYALVMGINDYPGTSSDLSFCVADAESVRTVLVDHYGFTSGNVTFLKDRQVTREAIDDYIQSLEGKVTAADEVVFFYSGHGSKGRADDGDSLKTDQAIVVCNSTYTGFDFVWDGELKSIFSILDTTRVLFAFDSCYAGGMTVLGAPGREVVMACTSSALSYESSAYGGGHGAFTWYYFCQGMDAGYADVKPDDDQVTAEEAFDYAKARLGSQTPVLSDGFANDLLP